MQQIRSEIDIPSLLIKANILFSNPNNYKIDGTNVLMLTPQSNHIPTYLYNLFYPAINEIKTILNQSNDKNDISPIHLMLNLLPPNIVVPKHRDTVKPIDQRLLRFHLPLSTNNQCFFWEEKPSNDKRIENNEIVMPIGYWYGPVEYWKLHSISNLGTTPRIHLIIDLINND